MSDENKNDKPGYKNPPKKYQFKKGQSGNPKGRKKGSRNLPAMYRDLLAEKVTIVEGGKHKEITSQEAIARRVRLDALRGKETAIDRILQYAAQNEDQEERLTFGEFLEKLNWDKMNEQEFNIIIRLFGMEKRMQEYEEKLDRFFNSSPKLK